MVWRTKASDRIRCNTVLDRESLWRNASASAGESTRLHIGIPPRIPHHKAMKNNVVQCTIRLNLYQHN